MKKKLSLLMIALLSMVGLVFATAYEPTNATDEILLTKANIEAQDYLSVTTDNWTTNKTYGGVQGDFYNMSASARQLKINVKGVSKFELFVQNSNAGRSYTVTVGNGEAQTITHNGGNVESSGEIETGSTGEVTITLAGDGSGSVYPVKIKLTKAEGGSTDEPGDEPGDEPSESTFRDIKLDLTQHTELLTGDDVLITVAEDGTIGTTDNQEEAAALVNGHMHNSYGSSNFTAIVPVEGTVKITYATHDYGNDITVTDDNGTEVAKLNTQGAKWMNDHANVVVAYYRTNEPTTLHFSNANYNPYFAVEAIDPADIPAEVTKYTVTFAAGEADGVAPAPVEVEAGNKITAPKNYTLYAANKTLTGWSDGTTTYAVGEEITPTADMTLTAQYTPNEVSLADRTEAVTISCDLSGYNDAPKYNFQNNTGIIVTQATVGGKAIDVRIDVDATSGKFAYNGSGWHLLNAGTKVSVPSCKGATFSVKTYQNANALKFGETAATAEADPATYTATADDAALVIEQTANGYWNQLTITLPVVEGEEPGDEPGDEPVAQDVTAMWDFANNCAQLAPKGEGGTYTAETMASNVEGIEMTIEYNGGQIKNNDNSYQVTNGVEMRIPVKSTEDIVTVSGYSGFSHYTIGNNDTELTNDQTYKAKQSDVQQGYVSVKSVNNNNYINYIKVEQKAPKEPTTLDNEAATATFPFNLGTEGQTATFSKPDYWLTSKVTLGSNLFIKGMDAKQQGQTVVQTNGKETAAGETNAIRFLIQPKFGFTFTPTKVSLKAAKYGTDNGTIDISWQNADNTTVSLKTGQAVSRDAATKYEFDVTGATPGEGICGIVVNLYGLQEGKNFGLSDIIIEGTLNGTEKDVPVLESFKINGTTYLVEDVFGTDYEATLELSKTEQMVNANNPLTDLTAINGEIGEVTYEGNDTECTVTIPMTAADVSLSYVLNVVQKPDFTLTYLDTDGTQMGTQKVEKDAAITEFAVDFNEAKADEDYKVRGWFVKESGGRKFTVNDIITADTKLYAVATEIEKSSEYKKYTFALNDQYFYAEDHEAFCPHDDAKCKWHDTTHGWSFYDGDKVDLLVGPKATVSIALCQYGKGTNILIKNAAGETLATLDGISTTDGDVVAYNYEGEAGTLTMEMAATGEAYIHYVKIVNTTTTNYASEGNWYFVKPGDASSLIDAIDAVNGQNASKEAERSFIFIPNGTYDLGTTCLTNVSGHNISLIGESMEGVIIKNKPEAEGIGVTATILNTGTNNYFQDLTLQNEWDYYGIAGDGRAVCLQDKGSNTICKNVTLLSHQDTYYTNNQDGKYYWETSDIHGTVDFICGEGTLFVNKSTLTVEKRTAAGSGECTITAPSTKAGNEYGYVFSDCKIENNAEKYNYGRAWNNAPRCAYINTTVNDDKLVASRWTLKGMNQYPATAFVEYNTMDEDGNVVSPDSYIVTFTAGKSDDTNPDFETILSEDQAAAFALDKVFTDWTPAELAKQVETDPKAELENGTITWTAVDGATVYAIYDGETLLGLVFNGTSFDVSDTQGAPSLDEEVTDNTTTYTIRVGNIMGGLSEDFPVTKTTGIKNLNVDQNGELKVYDLQGRRVNTTTKGVYIINGKKVVVK